MECRSAVCKRKDIDFMGKYAESYYRGPIYAKSGDWKNATDDYMTAVELDPKYTYDPESCNK